MLTEEMMKSKIAELATTTPKGLSLEGFDRFIDYLVEHELTLPEVTFVSRMAYVCTYVYFYACIYVCIYLCFHA